MAASPHRQKLGCNHLKEVLVSVVTACHKDHKPKLIPEVRKVHPGRENLFNIERGKQEEDSVEVT